MIVGVDEAGRGPLAGPVVAAAVLLCEGGIAGLDDSKKLSAKRRAELEALIKAQCRWWIGEASVEEIDRINILQAALLAMRRAVDALSIVPVLARVDGNQPPRLRCAVETVVGGDASDPAISAASILAKCARDAVMIELHQHFPLYGFDRHKWYATAEHLQCLRDHGPSPHHRHSFAPVRESLQAVSIARVSIASATGLHEPAGPAADEPS